MVRQRPLHGTLKMPTGTQTIQQLTYLRPNLAKAEDLPKTLVKDGCLLKHAIAIQGKNARQKLADAFIKENHELLKKAMR